MKMQDNQFDDLFRSKLEEFESEPTAGVWEGIEYHLGNKNGKRTLFPFIGIAASVLALIAIVLFIPQKIKRTAENSPGNKTAKVQQPVNVSAKSKNGEIVNTAAVSKTYTGTREINRKAGELTSVRNVSPQKAPVGEAQAPLKIENNAPVLATLPQKQNDIIKPVVPDDATELVAKQIPVETNAFIATPGLVAAEIPVVKDEPVLSKPKHKIHNMGDLINAVVAKVDKRKDKFIEFSDNDDDQSNVTGVNLGIIKIKKEK